MPTSQRKNRWSADVTEHSDALDLEPKVFEKKIRRDREIPQALRRSERSAKNKRLPIGDVDVDVLRQPRRAEVASRTEEDPGSRQRTIARIVRAQPLSVGRRGRIS